MRIEYVTTAGEKIVINPGLKGLIQLRKFSRINVNQKTKEIVFWGMWPQIVPELTQQEEKEIADKILAEIPLPTTDTIEEWYKQGLGEIGLSIDTLERLTPEELDLAYEGYLRRVELIANSIQKVIKQPQYKLLNLIPEKETSYGTKEEREETFKNLGIGGL